MDRKQKRFFILLGILALLYVASLGTGIWLNRGGDSSSPNSMQDTWVAKAGAWLSFGAPRLEKPALSRLKCENDGQRVAQPFGLTVDGNDDTGDCKVSISLGLADDEYRKIELEILRPVPDSASFGLYVLAEYEGDPSADSSFRPAERAPDCFLAGDGPEYAPTERHHALSGKRLQALRLQVKYAASDAEELSHPWACWQQKALDEPVSLPVMGRGGTLDLQLVCDDACPDKKHSIRLQIK